MVQGLPGGIPLSRGEFAVGLRTRSHRRPLFLILMPMSFGMGSPCGSSVLVGSHLITNEVVIGGSPRSFRMGFKPLSEASLRALLLAVRFLVILTVAASLREFKALSSVLHFLGSDTSLAYVSLGPSRSRSPIPSLAPSWWSPCLILRRALMTLSCCVLRVPSAFL